MELKDVETVTLLRRHERDKSAFDGRASSDSARSEVSDIQELPKHIEDAALSVFYKPGESYEGRHRWDPRFEWRASEEKELVKKIDWRICTWVCLMFFAMQIDRGNILQALSDNMLDDLGLTTNHYNTGQAIYFASFLVAELPSQLVCKKLGPDVWIPIQMSLWSTIATLQAFLIGKWSFWITRGLIGIFEGGFIPTVVLYLSYWYTSTELPVRMSYFYVAKNASNLVAAILAYGILPMRGLFGVDGWRWLFALEGLLTLTIGVLSYYYLPPSPTQTASKFRGLAGWFSVYEEKIMVNRVLRDDPSKGDMHNREALTSSMLWQCITDYHVWPMYLLGLTWEMPKIPTEQYLTLTLKAAGFATSSVNLLTIPPNLLWIVNLLVLTRISEAINERVLLGMVGQVWVLPILIALVILPETRSKWTTLILVSLLFAQPYIHAMLVALTSRNSGSVRTRTVSAALYNMSLQASNVIATNIYRTADAPYYYHGNKIIIGIVCYNLIIFWCTKLFYVNVNRRREAVWKSMPITSKEAYLATTADKGNKRLDFRFAH